MSGKKITFKGKEPRTKTDTVQNLHRWMKCPFMYYNNNERWDTKTWQYQKRHGYFGQTLRRTDITTYYIIVKRNLPWLHCMCLTEGSYSIDCFTSVFFFCSAVAPLCKYLPRNGQHTYKILNPSAGTLCCPSQYCPAQANSSTQQTQYVESMLI